MRSRQEGSQDILKTGEEKEREREREREGEKERDTE
jgi:hypothetical protein